jgi:hypothetical protein
VPQSAGHETLCYIILWTSYDIDEWIQYDIAENIQYRHKFSGSVYHLIHVLFIKKENHRLQTWNRTT